MLTSFQKKVSAAALTCFSICVIAAFIVLIFVLLGKFLSTFGLVVMPVAVALILSFMLSPMVAAISKYGKIDAAWSCIITFVIISTVLGGILIFAIPIFIDQIAQMLSAIPDAVQNVAHHLIEKYPAAKDVIVEKIAELKKFANEGISLSLIGSAIKRVSITATAATGGIISICGFATALAVTPIYLYYMLTTNLDFFGKLERNLNFIKKSTLDDIVFLTRRFAEIMSVFFRGQMTIAFIMGLLLGTGLMIAGVKFGFVLGFTAGVLNIIPYFGTIIGLSTILPVAGFQDGGGLFLAAAALGIFIIVQLIEGYLLTPKIMGDRTGLHPTVIIFSVFFWGTALNGILGMILAIPLTAFIVALWQRILQRAVEKETRTNE